MSTKSNRPLTPLMRRELRAIRDYIDQTHAPVWDVWLNAWHWDGRYLAPLERRGLIEHDRKVGQFRLTPAGREALGPPLGPSGP